MSIENHPNFDAVRFASYIIEAYYNCKRRVDQDLPSINDYVVEFVGKVEELVDTELGG
jgi:hypothetical protein